MKQPWAHLIVVGIKDVENRTWRTSHRGPLLIHAAKRVDANGDRARRLLAEDGWAYSYIDGVDLILGAVIGRVHLVDVVRDHESIWGDDDSWHWVLSGAQRIDPPIYCRGERGHLFVPRL